MTGEDFKQVCHTLGARTVPDAALLFGVSERTIKRARAGAVQPTVRLLAEALRELAVLRTELELRRRCRP